MPIVEGLIVNILTEILKKLGPLVTKKIGAIWNVKDDLKRLEKTLEIILAVISEAEKRQETETPIRSWLKWLRDVAYDADDILDELSYKSMRPEVMNRNKLYNFVSKTKFSIRTAHKIKGINKTLDEISKDMGRFHFTPTTNTTLTTGRCLELDRETDSYGDDSEIIVERDKDLSNIVVELLLNSSANENISVLPVVGMGGIGKTTLAQQVFHNELVQTHFDPKIWICVSDIEFDVNRISRGIIGSITRSTCHDIPTTDELVRRVREKLSGKKFFLVLDDMWTEDAIEWENLRKRLIVGAQGSKVLVTTRSHKVASNIKEASSTYNLQILSNEGCWSIIKHRAFPPGEELTNPHMINLGKEIAAKCGGVPLAAKTLGCLMYKRKEESEWQNIRRDRIMDIKESDSRIKEILKLSYHHLPSHLKRCFSYCSIFPKDWEFEKETLIQLWMAEGFLPSPLMEEVGNENFDILLRNSLFQKSPKGDKYYKMHDLIHDVAESVSENNECLNVKARKMGDISSEARRVGVVFDEINLTKLPTKLPIKLRTLLTFNANVVVETDHVFTSKYLRVLDVTDSQITHLRSSVLRLKHLRYLNLSKCVLKVDNLSIGSLYNLQTLVLKETIGMGDLVKDIGGLKNLRHLHLNGFVGEELPMSITSLSNLKTLDLGYCSQLHGLPNEIGDLKHLKHLSLASPIIYELPSSITSCDDLEELNLARCTNLIEVPEDLGALKHLRLLNVSYTRLRRLPNSLGGLKSLRTLQLENCEKLEALPEEIGALELLRYLNLQGSGIKVLPESCITGLRNLVEADLGEDCELPSYIGNWTKLTSLKYRRDTKDTFLGIGLLTCLKTLNGYVVRENRGSCGGGIGELGGLGQICGKLSIFNLERVRGGTEEAKRAELKEKPNITSLTLEWDFLRFERYMYKGDVGENLDEDGVLEGLRPHSNVKHLKVIGYNGLKLPSWITTNISSYLEYLEVLDLGNWNRCEKLQGLGQLPNLKSLTLRQMRNLLQWIEKSSYSSPSSSSSSYSFPMLQSLVINGCRELTRLPTIFPCLKKLEISFSNVKVLNINMTGLESIKIKGIREVDFLPRKILQPQLHTLMINWCYNFKGFLPKLEYPELRCLERLTCVEVDGLSNLQCDKTRTALEQASDRVYREGITVGIQPGLRRGDINNFE